LEIFRPRPRALPAVATEGTIKSCTRRCFPKCVHWFRVNSPAQSQDKNIN
jgi:hypothetical protein